LAAIIKLVKPNNGYAVVNDVLTNFCNDFFPPKKTFLMIKMLEIGILMEIIQDGEHCLKENKQKTINNSFENSFDVNGT
jgi:hypothetical protein